jgi:3-phenylpropionate/trans-cinnamate dioxygenase ferredoxin subunit
VATAEGRSGIRHELFPVEELPVGGVRAVEVDGLGLVIIRHPDGSVRALRDRCSHYGARLSLGQVRPKTIGDMPGAPRSFSGTEYVLRCPWHQYEFDIDTGRCVADPVRHRVKTYDVRVEDGTVVLIR